MTEPGDEMPGPFWRRPIAIPPFPGWRRTAATLAGLWGFAFVDPVLGVVGPERAFFTTHGVTGWGVVAWLVLICLAPPLLLTLALSAIGHLRPRTGFVGLLMVSAVLLAFVLVPRLDEQLRLGDQEFLTLAAMCALAFAALTLCSSGLRRFVAATWFSPAVFAALFLLASPASGIVLPGDTSSSPRASTPKNLAFVVLDEFPAVALMAGEQIDAARFPGFARLAAISTWYRDTTATSVRTEFAIPSLLTGTEPIGGKAPPPADALPHNIFRMLAASNDLYSAEPMVRLCDFPGCNKVDDPALVDLYRDTALVMLREWMPEARAEESLASLEAGWAFVEADSVGEMASLTELIRTAEARRSPPARPALWYAHALLPHRPWASLPGGFNYPGGFEQPPGGQAGEGYGAWHDDPRVVELMRQRLLLQIQALDDVMGELADSLADERISVDTMVVVTADHGLSFEHGGHIRGFDLAPEQYAEIVRVPLFVRYPGQTVGRVDDRPASLIDIAPTVADVMDVRLPKTWSQDGHSLATREPASRARRSIFDDSGRIVLPRRLDVSAAVAKYAALGSGPGGALFSLGELGPLVGRSWGSLSFQGTGVEATLIGPESFEDVEPQVEVPALVQALLPPNLAGRWVAVSVNGRVAGTGVVYEHEGTTRAAAMVDPRAFHRGRNHIEIAVGSDPGQPLVRLNLVR